MSYCINPSCAERQNIDSAEICKTCGTTLLLNERIRLIAPLRPINPRNYSDVFEVDDEGKRRVMKVLKSNEDFSLDIKLIELLERESLALQLLRHPNIPRSRIYDYFTFTPNNTTRKLHCLVMDKVDGENLEQWLEKHGPISQSRAMDWLEQIVHILDNVHQAGFFHRDIKPANIILKLSGELALIDFGAVKQVTETYLAKISGAENKDGSDRCTDITQITSSSYSPPEQLNRQALPQSDFFAIGRTFVYLLTGIHPGTFPVDPLSGELLWKNKAPQIDYLLARFIDELMSLAPGKRPYNTRIILERLNARKPFQPPERWRKSTPGKMETIVNLKINQFPALVWATDQGWYGFEIDTGDRLITVELPPELFDKLEQAQEKYPKRWTANISGKIRRGPCGELSLESPKLRIYTSKLESAELDKKLILA